MAPGKLKVACLQLYSTLFLKFHFYQRTVSVNLQKLAKIRVFHHFQTTKQCEQWRRLCQMGVLEDELLDTVWRDSQSQKSVLLGLMDKFDLLCICRSNKQVSQ